MSHLLPIAALAQIVVDRTTNDSDAAGWLFGLGGAIAIVVLLFILAALALVVWAVIDLIGNPRIDGTLKIVWALVIFFLPFVGSLIYLVIGRSASESATAGGGPA